MAFTDEGKILKVAKILKIDSIRLTEHLTLYTNYFTETRNALIDQELDMWATVGGKFTKIHPMEKNFGAEIDPSDSKGDVVENLESLFLLGRTEWYHSNRSSEIWLERG